MSKIKKLISAALIAVLAVATVAVTPVKSLAASTGTWVGYGGYETVPGKDYVDFDLTTATLSFTLLPGAGYWFFLDKGYTIYLNDKKLFVTEDDGDGYQSTVKKATAVTIKANKKNKTIKVTEKTIEDKATKAAEAVKNAATTTSTDDALAQYYAALEKQKAKDVANTAVDAAKNAAASNEELLAQYYAALEKQNKKK